MLALQANSPQGLWLIMRLAWAYVLANILSAIYEVKQANIEKPSLMTKGPE